VGPSFVIERFEFLYKNEWRFRAFKGLVTFLTGPAGSGKSTGAESLLYALGLTKIVSYVVITSWAVHGAGYVELDCSGRVVGDRGAADPTVEGASAGRRDAGHTG
jgi:energy-coupling factor transporter ATP-binding protein EcfA2